MPGTNISVAFALFLQLFTVSYNVDAATIAGFMAADVLLTLAVVLLMYKCASRPRAKDRDRGDRLYMNVRKNINS
ncbi:unnamed protein product [Merluccius merluccius]